MVSLRDALQSSVGRKVITALTGLLMVLFTLVHLLGNLTLFVPGGEAFNTYALALKNLGPLFYVAEVGLVVLFGAHIVNGVMLKLDHKRARPEGYTQLRSKGGPSYSSVSSRNMAITGSILAIFIVAHVLHFRLGPAEAEGYVVTVKGQEARDLYRLVKESFQNPWVALTYSGVMVVLAMHLWHGFWSAFHSLGALAPRLRPAVMALGWLISIVLAVGFIAIPLFFYFGFGG
jgi:succinate dehydrogenase / fumarate reductase cytochrome b subunit